MKELNEQYYSLRINLESALKLPAVIVVGSASDEDRSGEVACDLGRAFADAGYATVVVDAFGGSIFNDEYGVAVKPVQDVSAVCSSAMNGTIKNLSAVGVAGAVTRVNASAAKIRMAIAQLRMKFEVIVIHAGVIPREAGGLQFASVADGVILSFRFGRKPTAADRDVVPLLERVGAPVLGVVAIGSEKDRRPEPLYKPGGDVAVPQQVLAASPAASAADRPAIAVVATAKEMASAGT
jgi:Mrp family chromosome partitioning ATPase